MSRRLLIRALSTNHKSPLEDAIKLLKDAEANMYVFERADWEARSFLEPLERAERILREHSLMDKREYEQVTQALARAKRLVSEMD